MKTYERNGIHLEQCDTCRGIFLDRGELERLVDAEATWSQRGEERPAPAPAPPPQPEPRHEQPRYDQPRYDQPRDDQPRYDRPKYDQPRYDQPKYDKGYQQGYRKPHKKRSFFEELFD